MPIEDARADRHREGHEVRGAVRRGGGPLKRGEHGERPEARGIEDQRCYGDETAGTSTTAQRIEVENVDLTINDTNADDGVIIGMTTPRVSRLSGSNSRK